MEKLLKKLMVSVLSGVLLVGVASQALAWETQRKLDKSERYEMRRLENDERDGRISPRRAEAIEQDIEGIRSEENYLKHHGRLSQRNERELQRELRYDNQAINRAERGWW
jgi:hypothetical protein